MSIQITDLQSPISPTWCPGCGNFSILTALKKALIELNLEAKDVVIVFGIGCSGNMADFIKTNGFHALHGRAIANAIGIKLANHRLKVIVTGGDGDLYGEGFNHLLAAARGNHDISVFVHNNERYSLTTGQTSPASKKGTVGKSTPQGVIEEAINPLALAISANASFVARGFAGQSQELVELMKQAIMHEGFALVDILQPCPSFNKTQDNQWYIEHTQKLKADYDLSDREQALKQVLKKEPIELGVFYQDQGRLAYHQELQQLTDKSLIEQFPDHLDLQLAIEQFI
ncbi:2-oxoacid:ferredoxin oxidoreductase subunit beta [Candidatus Woesebacteria bacterium]|jgi:2-oxoglutarate ferredoxin oxidoreductase subunit beta|nr:2-oxoacid:ferredoxin oxidoreductase subunit beta [Candidatus Woesebacteria bacterium]HNV44938.1 thiamine pyrophosphate-dependent enzyme [Candidatus Woesebacteria bacterium]HOC07715.1 thiamine pyrophosphate-dependent enzyme [Candidatus Woesebacteria bacterium]HOI05205.1 thiamine pyrophosphate-dependent enzyme [Candidatus Woesebacteria bacterium]HOP38725.1 thiamine pyrophosphate-dependent enzyme [Candidatus Woesebacteria bacterium]